MMLVMMTTIRIRRVMRKKVTKMAIAIVIINKKNKKIIGRGRSK